jgi:hypothetical protein
MSRFTKLTSFRLTLPRHVKTPFLISYLSSISSILIALVFFFTLQPMIPLFYSLASPQAQLVGKEWLVLFPAISFGISFIHTLIVQFIYHEEALLAQLFAWTTVIVQLLLMLGLLRIIFIVT